MDLKKYMNRIEQKYDKPYIQIPRRLIVETNMILKKHEAERYTDYAFSFLLLNAFLYKYAHYVDYDAGDYLTLSNLKEILKYNPNNQNINKISKRDGGILEHEALVEITEDIPIFINYSERNKQSNNLETRKILRLSDVGCDIEDDVKSAILRTPTHYVYIPDFMIDYSTKQGTLNDYRSTVKITYKEFRGFMFNPELTLKDFLVYSFIKSSSDKDGNSRISYDRAKRTTGLSHVTFKRSIEKLRKMKVIDVEEGLNVERYKKQAKLYSVNSKFKKKVGI